MPAKIKNLAGKRFGMLQVLEMDASSERGAGKSIRWIVKCDCGAVRSIFSYRLNSKRLSCGCKRGFGRKIKYGIPKHMLQRWTNMMRRCYHPTSEKDKRNYMDRGITVCNEWHDPKRFYADVGEPPFFGASIDRIDNDKGYSPGNVRWANWSTQNKNRRPQKRGFVSLQPATL